MSNNLCSLERSLDSSHAQLIISQQNNLAAVAEAQLMANSRPPTRQPGIGIKASLMQLTREEIKQQELAVSISENPCVFNQVVMVGFNVL